MLLIFSILHIIYSAESFNSHTVQSFFTHKILILHFFNQQAHFPSFFLFFHSNSQSRTKALHTLHLPPSPNKNSQPTYSWLTQPSLSLTQSKP
ncbi:basic proline-rich protein-like [Iris pallida]|uniref:Basic proline-rich protein-like n=1 Tax=Iris pallida TaxID=29817 RepID=A0AAX6G346_IRIPA|nr:basic proline-rich protein-like [Iris pallida]